MTTGGYDQLVGRVCVLVRETVPPGAYVLVVSHGDGRLLEVPGRRAEHFPQTSTGLYAGHHPADGPSALAELHRLREIGAGYLVIPETGRWWLTYYGDLRDWLVTHGRMLADRAGTGAVFALDRAARRLHAAAAHVASLTDALVPAGIGLVVVGPPGAAADVRDRPVLELPPDGPIDELHDGWYVALVPPADPARLPKECRLVCRRHVVDLYRVGV
jgi:hypothetical protein